MKNLLISFLLTTLIISCTGSITTNSGKDTLLSIGHQSDPHLKINQLFYHTYGTHVSLFIVRDKNNKGYYITSSEWLYRNVPVFESFSELDEPSFKPLRMATKYEISHWDISMNPIKINDSLSIIKPLTK